jgi:hypothetical protein
MSDVIYFRSLETLSAFGREIIVSNFTRPNHDGTLPRTIPGNVPYYPQHFPAGQWKITDPLPRTAADLAPWFIPTDANQLVPEWSLTPDGKMDKPTGHMVPDSGYGIHYSQLDFTWGCIRVVNRSDLEWLVAQIQNELSQLKAMNPDEAWISFEAQA